MCHIFIDLHFSKTNASVGNMRHGSAGLFWGENDRSGYVEVMQTLFHANDRRSHGEFEPIKSFFLPKFPVDSCL